MRFSLLIPLICFLFPDNCTPFSLAPIRGRSHVVSCDKLTGTERDLARMLSAVKRKESSTASQSPVKDVPENRQGFGAIKTSVNASESSSRNRAADKQRYRELLRAAKKSDVLAKVIGTGVDAKIPKQTFTSGSSRGR